MDVAEIIRHRVVTKDGHVLGVVSSLDVNPHSWMVERVGIKLERRVLESVGVRKPALGTMRVQIPVAFVSGVADELVLHKTLDELSFADHETREETDAAKGDGEQEG